MGSSVQRRGYADESLYMAMTSQGKVAPMSVGTIQSFRECSLLKVLFSKNDRKKVLVKNLVGKVLIKCSSILLGI